MNIYSFDLDGTLLPHHDGVIPQEIFDKINSFVDNGDIVIFNSGRPYDILRKYMDPIHLSDKVYFSIDNGAALLKQSGEVLYYEGVESNEIKALYLDNPGLSIFSYSLDSILYGTTCDKYCDYECMVNQMPFKALDLNTDLSNIVMLKFLLCGTDEELDNAVIRYDSNKYTLIRTKGIMYEIINKKAGKEFAIEYLISKYQTIDNVYVFGDGDNDAVAIKNYIGVTFVNGSPKCKEVAKYVSPYFADQGTLDAFKHFKL